MEIQDWIESFVRAFFCLTGIIGNNWLCLCSLPKSRSQLRTNDILFVNLAVSNLITNCLVDLPDTMAHFVNSWFMGKNYCGVIQFSADLSETSSIFTTMFISLYWHQKLVGSLKRGGAPVQMDNLRLLTVLLGGSWAVALAFSVPHFFITEHDGNDSLEVCEEHFPSPEARQTFDGFYLTLANVVPIIGITYASVQIALTLLRSQKRIKDHSKGLRGRVDPPSSVDQKLEGTSDHRTESFSEKSPAGSRAEGVRNSNRQPAAQTSRAVNTISSHQQQAPKTQSRPNSSSSTNARAAKSVVAVATIFLFCWLTHLVLRIYSSFKKSILAIKLTNFIGASYTCFVPFIYLYGVKKLNCSCC